MVVDQHIIGIENESANGSTTTTNTTSTPLYSVNLASLVSFDIMTPFDFTISDDIEYDIYDTGYQYEVETSYNDSDCSNDIGNVYAQLGGVNTSTLFDFQDKHVSSLDSKAISFVFALGDSQRFVAMMLECYTNKNVSYYNDSVERIINFYPNNTMTSLPRNRIASYLSDIFLECGYWEAGTLTSDDSSTTSSNIATIYADSECDSLSLNLSIK